MTITYGQISPGDLSEAHKELEGISNCTQCHELGEKVLNSKCLKCHTQIQELINNKHGLHASPTVVKQDCFKCHSEHHGRKFDEIRFDVDNFDHNLTGYKLEGKHQTIDCKECHKTGFIQNPEIRKNPDTFLGLNQECKICHVDVHQETLGNDCRSCHDMESFKPASQFDHNETLFKLRGKHLETKCIQCHKISKKNDLDFQEFKGIAFNDCKSCHKDPHMSNLPGNCKECHTETSFSIFKGQGRFNHNKTEFKLKGKHKTIDCFACHKERSDPKIVFQDNLNINENNCIECHEDIHESKFGNDCAKCHNEKSFVSLNNMDFFDHSLTDYTLEGKHIDVDCKKCHTDRYTQKIDFSACNNCHVDYHQNEFNKDGISPDCIECHSLNEGFEYSLYTLERHQDNEFPLFGAHLATPCFACHISEDEERWKFKNIGSTCVDCHKDIHEGFIDKKFYPDNQCVSCHVNDNWSIINFNHNSTDWPLDGKHTEVVCRDCHFNENEMNNNFEQKFVNLDTQCITCHENIHDDAFAIDGITDCKRCHVTSSWLPENFDHDTTNFPLIGKHKEIACTECHTTSIVNDEEVILYKLNKFECVDCHQ